MSRRIALVFVAIVVSGCVTTQRAPPEDAVSKLHTIAIVPIEAPPLLVHPTKDDRAALAAAGLAAPGSTSGGSAFIPITPNPGVNAASAAIGLINLWASSAPSKGDVITVTKEQAAAWMPTAQLAIRAAQMLRDTGRQEAFVIEGYARLPVADRSVNDSMENWYAPVRRWYNADVSVVDYGEQRTLGDAILEVGVLNYEYIWQRLVLQIMVKLIDPTSKKVIARAREYSSPKGKSLGEMLQNEGEPLRDLIIPNAQTLLLKCLQDIALIPR